MPLDERGLPEVDPCTMRIGDTPVLLAGDANGDNPLLHEATDDGHIAGINATSKDPIRMARRTPLGLVFCDPEIAYVGQRANDLDPETTLFGEVSFAHQSRALIMQENRGLIRLYASRSDGRLLGDEMVIPAAEHMAVFLALAIGQQLTVHDLLRVPYPTLEEGLRTALRVIARQLPPGALSDLAHCEELGAEALDGWPRTPHRAGDVGGRVVTDTFLLAEMPPELPRERERVLALVREAVPHAEVLEVGSTAVEGVIGKQDLDVLVRVAREDFERTRRRLDREFARDPQQLSNDAYQGYCVPSSIDAALQLTVGGCRYDRFLPFLDALRNDPALVRSYNELKRRWHGRAMDDYCVAKAAFIEAVLGR